MKYDFTSVIDRRGKDALAVDAVGAVPGGPGLPGEGFDIIPMWVADMNFPTCPTIPEAIIERAKHPMYGYFQPREEYTQEGHGFNEGMYRLSKRCVGWGCRGFEYPLF